MPTARAIPHLFIFTIKIFLTKIDNWKIT